MSNKNNVIETVEPEFDWISFPFVDRPKISALLSLFLILFTYLLKEFIKAIHMGPAWWIIGMALIVLSLTPYFVPSRYRFYKSKIIANFWFHKVERPYTDFGCFYSDKLGLMLGTFKRPRRLDPFRGLSVRYSKKQTEKEEILKFLETKIGNKF